MTDYLASDRMHVASVAQRIRNLPDTACPAFGAQLLTFGIMVPSQKRMRFAHWLAMKRNPKACPFYCWVHLLSRKFGDRGIPAPNSASLELRAATADWCEAGQDVSDDTSVGGFNQNELEAVVELLDILAPIA